MFSFSRLSVDETKFLSAPLFDFQHLQLHYILANFRNIKLVKVAFAWQPNLSPCN